MYKAGNLIQNPQAKFLGFVPAKSAALFKVHQALSHHSD